jgi:hypothetical protein
MKYLFIAPMILLGACQTIVTTPPADCVAFIPDSWKLAIPGAPLPADDTLPEWQKFGVAQSGQLSKANGRSDDIIHIVTICEKRANDARPRKKFLGIF